MSSGWNLSSEDDDDDDDDDDFEHWALGQHQQLLFSAAAAPINDDDKQDNNNNNNDDEFYQQDSDNEDEWMDRKPAAVAAAMAITEEGVPFLSDFDRPKENDPDDDDDIDDDNEDEVDWEDADDGEDVDANNNVAKKLPTEAITLDLNPQKPPKAHDDKTTKKTSLLQRAKRVFRYHHLPHDLQQFLHHIRQVHLMGWASHATVASQYASQDDCLHLSHSILPRAWALPRMAPPDGASTSAPTTTTTTAPTMIELQHFVQCFEELTAINSATAYATGTTASAVGMATTRGGRASMNRKSRKSDVSKKNNNNNNKRNNRSKRKHTAMATGGVTDDGGDSSTIHYRIPQYCLHLANHSRTTTILSLYNEYDRLLLFLSMARSMGWRARYVVAVEPISQDLDVNHPLFEVMTNRNIFLGVWNATNKRRKAAANPIDLTASSDDDDDDKKKKESKPASIKQEMLQIQPDPIPRPLCWIEVLYKSPQTQSSTTRGRAASKSGLQWTHIDPILGSVNHPALVEQQLYAYQQLKTRSAINPRKRSPIPYAVAVEHVPLAVAAVADELSSPPSLRMADVTPRYAYSMVESLQARGLGQEKQPESAKNDWFSNFLRQHSSHTTKEKRNKMKSTAHSSSAARGKTADDAIILDSDEGAKRSGTNTNVVTPEPLASSVPGNDALQPYHMEHEEEEQLETMTKREPLPTSKAAFKKHPTYVVASCLNSTEVLLPDAKKRTCGIFKGELVFLRSDVENALPAKKWLYKGRKVRDNELRKPILKVNARKKTSKGGFKALKSYGVGSANGGSEESIEQQIYDASQPLGDGKVHLFGSWQTDPWSPASVGPNDEIPVNEYDNVELELLNPGLVHVDLRGVAKTAKRLSIPYKPCLLGFEGHGGNRTPTMRGVVVHAHNEVLLRDAHAEVSHHLQEKEEEAKKNDILRKWKRLLVGVLTKERLERTYGNNDDE